MNIVCQKSDNGIDKHDNYGGQKNELLHDPNDPHDPDNSRYSLFFLIRIISYYYYNNKDNYSSYYNNNNRIVIIILNRRGCIGLPIAHQSSE